METWMPDIFEQMETGQLSETIPRQLNEAFKNIQAKSGLETDHNAILSLEGWGPHRMVQEHVPPPVKEGKTGKESSSQGSQSLPLINFLSQMHILNFDHFCVPLPCFCIFQ